MMTEIDWEWLKRNSERYANEGKAEKFKLGVIDWPSIGVWQCCMRKYQQGKCLTAIIYEKILIINGS